MASGRLLITFILTATFFISVLGACGSTPGLADLNPVSDSTSDEDQSSSSSQSDTKQNQNENEQVMNPNDLSFYEQYQTKLSDLYTTNESVVPEAFLVEESPEEEVEEEKDLFQGFRVQIYSGKDVLDADTTAAQFRIWADTTIAGYQADTYIFFKPPYYRIHVGDFHSRIRANEYARLVKRRFRGAWVVYDRVNPWNVPADSVSFSLIPR